MKLNDYLERAMKELNERALPKTAVKEEAGEGYEDEKNIARKMKAKGYKMVILFPSEMGLSPLYVQSLMIANQLMRKEFRMIKDYQIKKISEFIGEKEKENEAVMENVDWQDFYKMAKDTSGKTLKDYEKKYGGAKFQMPHIKDALKKSKDFPQFMKMIKKFEKEK